MKLVDFKKTALIWDDINVSYSELIENKNRISSIIKKNIGGRIIIISENRLDYAYVLYAIWKKGMVPVPVDYLSSKEEIEHIINDCQPEYIFCTNETLNKINDCDKNSKIKIINIDLLFIQQLEEDASPDYDFLDDETLLIIYTSGTTGTPKGVMITKANIMLNIEGVTKHFAIYKESDVTLAFLPLHHSFPLIGTIVMPLYAGGTTTFTPTLAAEDILKTLQNNKVSIIIGVPRFYEMILKSIREKINSKFATKLIFNICKKIRSLKLSKIVFGQVHQKFGGKVSFMVAGGAAIEKSIVDDYYTLGFEMLEGYGMTEAAPMITFTRPGEVLPGSAGKPLPGCEIKIVDDEIVCRGRNIMKGYFNRPEETADVLKDGWLYTGDLGRLDENGNIFITGRKKEIIVLSNGKNINPIEIENEFLSKSNLIKEIAVFNANDLLYAVIKSENNNLTTEELFKLYDQIRNEYNLKVSNYKRIAKIILTDEDLPRTRLSKIQRFKLIKFLDNNSVIATNKEPDYEEFKILKKYLSELKKCPVYSNSSFDFDLGLDSLDKVNLQVFLQVSFGINIDSSEFKNYESVLELAEYIKTNKTSINYETTNWSKILKEKIDLKLPKSWISQVIFFKIVKVFFKFYFRLKSEGIENIPDTSCIIASNHQSFYDSIFVSIFLKSKHLRETFYYAKEKHIKSKLLKYFANKHNIIIMNLNKDVKESIQKMAVALEKGKKIMIFPEGTRTSDGKLGQFKQTFAILSKELNVPVVPVVIKGAFEALPKGSIIPKPFKKISVKFLKPIYPGDNSSENILDNVYDTFAKNI